MTSRGPLWRKGVSMAENRPRQALYCQLAMERLYQQVAAHEDMPDDARVTVTSIQDSIKALRRELLVLSKMYPGA